MLAHVFPITALLAGVALLLLGNGLLTTLLAVRGSLEGFSDFLLGLIGSAYFAGFLLGTYLAPPLIRRIGHIRAFAFFAAGTAAIALAQGLFVSPLSWAVLRLATGTGLVALYMIIESWLNSQASKEQRGRIFAIYMVVNLAALALAQQLLRFAVPVELTLFAVSGLFFCLAVMPVAATRLAEPARSSPGSFAIRRLLRERPVAVAGGFLSGLAMGAFWSMGPVYGARIGFDEAGVAAFMSAAIVGGALLQWPLGTFSDHRDRRTALGLAALAAAVAALPLLAGAQLGIWTIAVIALWGGMSFAIYPMTVAHLVDHLAANDIVSGSSALLLVHGIGAALGPLLAGLLMNSLGPPALALQFALAQGLLALAAAASVRRGRDEVTEPAHFVPMLRTSTTVLEIMPAAQADSEPES